VLSFEYQDSKEAGETTVISMISQPREPTGENFQPQVFLIAQAIGTALIGFGRKLRKVYAH
jgi:hypothetical protein